MGFFDWLFKRLFTKKRIQYLTNQFKEEINLKHQVMDVLSDEEIAQNVIGYSDAIYDRYFGKSGKLWGSLGGIQKGINAQNGDNGMPFDFSLLENLDNLSLASLVRIYMASKMGNPSTPTQIGSMT